MQNDIGVVDIGDARDQHICDLARSCRSLFLQIRDIGRGDEDYGSQHANLNQRLENLSRGLILTGPGLELSDISHEHGQFYTWAQNLGVFALVNYSLDFRLRYASEMRDGVISLLSVLEEDLHEFGWDL